MQQICQQAHSYFLYPETVDPETSNVTEKLLSYVHQKPKDS